MTGAGCSLGKMAEAMRIPIGKIDLKIELVASTYEQALKNKDKIIEYCKRDTDLLYPIFKQFKSSLCDIIDLHCGTNNGDKMGKYLEKIN